MVRVTGEYCPAAAQRCIKYHEEYLSKKGNGTVSERCMEYQAPSRCLVDKKKQLDFCVDRYEYPNRVGELPWVLTSWRQARNLCREQGKRLCTEDEYNFACEGPEMLPYTTGYVRDAEKCNIDREYHRPDHTKRLLTYERCLQDETCNAELERLDQRHAIGSRTSCVSWCGAVDLNGNVNEWVSRAHQEPPNRSGLKGGWWGPVRNRCRPTVRFHKEFDYGYEAGFRCCKGFGDERVDPRYDLEQHNISPEQVAALKQQDRKQATPGTPKGAPRPPTPDRPTPDTASDTPSPDALPSNETAHSSSESSPVASTPSGGVATSDPGQQSSVPPGPADTVAPTAPDTSSSPESNQQPRAPNR